MPQDRPGPGRGQCRHPEAGGGGLAQSYHITDPWDASTFKTLGSYITAGYIPTWIISYSGPGHDCARLIKGVAPVLTGVTDGQTGHTPVTVHFPIDLSKIKLSVYTELSNGALDPNTVKVPLNFQKLTDGMTFTNDGIYQLIVVTQAPSQPPVVQVMTFTIDHVAPVTDLSLLNPLAFGAAQRAIGGSVVASKYPGVGKPGKVEVVSSDTLSGVKTIKTSLDGGALAGYSNDTNFNPVLVVNQSGDHSLRIVSTDAAGNVKEVTKYFTVFGAVARPSPSPSPSAKPSPKPTPSCPTKLTSGSLSASFISNTFGQYNVNWKSSGGCAPYSGTITGSICYPDATGKIVCSAPYWTARITTPTGSRLLSPQPPCNVVTGGFIRFC